MTNTKVVFETDTHLFLMDGNSRVISKEKSKPAGMLESQHVQTLLLLEIASELRTLRQLKELHR